MILDMETADLSISSSSFSMYSRYAAIVQSRVSTILAAGGAEESHLAAVVNSLCSDGSRLVAALSVGIGTL